MMYQARGTSCRLDTIIAELQGRKPVVPKPVIHPATDRNAARSVLDRLSLMLASNSTTATREVSYIKVLPKEIDLQDPAL